MIPIGLVLIAAGSSLAAYAVPRLKRASSSQARALSRSLLPDLLPEANAGSDDLARGAKFCALAGLGLFLASLGIFAVGDHWQLNTTPNNAFSGIGLFVAFAGMFSWWQAQKLWSAARRRRRQDATAAKGAT